MFKTFMIIYIVVIDSWLSGIIGVLRKQTNIQ